MTDDEIRDRLARALPESLGPVGLRRRAIPALGVEGSVTGYGVDLLDAVLPVVRAIVADELRDRAAMVSTRAAGEQDDLPDVADALNEVSSWLNATALWWLQEREANR